jgi:hypothetical protein
MRCILKFVLFLNKIFLKIIKSIPIMNSKLEMTNRSGGVWLSKYPNLIPQNIEINVNTASKILVTIPTRFYTFRSIFS